MMEQFWLIMVLLSGWYTSSACLRQYHFVNDLKNWTEAQSYCREKYTDLATVDNMDEMNQLLDIVLKAKSHPPNAVWIGLYDVDDSWSWSWADEAYYTGGEADFRNWENWNDDEPDNSAGGRQFCVAIGDNGGWWDDTCKETYPFICYKGGTQSDPKFILEKTEVNWPEAQRYCRENYIDLASVRNLTENQEIQRLVPEHGYAWIGLSREPWRWWSDGSNSSFRYWCTENGEPNNRLGNETCVVSDFTISGKWEDWPCYTKLHFVCYSSVQQQVFKLKLTQKDSSMNLNDPAVLAAILEQIQDRLKDKGISADLKWRPQRDGKVFHEEDKSRDQKYQKSPDMTKKEL